MKNINNNILKNKFINIFMENGNKKTSEKILLKSIKSLQRLNNKESKKLIQKTIINLSLTFKTKNQITKKGKRKVSKNINIFLQNDLYRIISAIKLMKKTINNKKKSYYYSTFAQEILETISENSLSLEKKKELQKQLFINKRYLSNFRW